MTRTRILAVMAGVIVLLALLGTIMSWPRAADPMLLGAVRLGQQPRDVLVDAGAGRAFVSTSTVPYFTYTTNGGSGGISILDTASGTVLRTITIGAQPIAMLVDTRRAHLLVMRSTYTSTGTDTRVLIIDERHGNVLHSIFVDPGLYPRSAGLALDERSGHLFVAGAEVAPCAGSAGCSTITTFDTTNGSFLRGLDVSGQIEALAVDGPAHRLIVLGDLNGNSRFISVLDATSGQLVRRVPIGGSAWNMQQHAVVVDERAGRAFVLTATSINAGAVYVVDTHRGALVRTDTLGSAPFAIAVDGRRGRAFVTTLGSFRPVRAAAPGGPSTQPVPQGAGRVSVIDARSGAIVRTVVVGTLPTAVGVDTRRGRVFVANAGSFDATTTFAGPGAVSVLDAQSGALLRTVPAGVLPFVMAIDERAGRALIVNYGGKVHVADSWAWLPPWLRRVLPFLPQPAPGARTVPGAITLLDTSR